jgi:hypothetical protein
MPGWAPVAANQLTTSVDGRVIQAQTVPRQTFASLFIPLPPGNQRTVRLAAGSVFPLPHDGRQRAFAIKNISFDNLSQTDLFARGWHRSGYLFGITGSDTDGWVEHRLDLVFPATTKFKEAVVQIIRYPSPRDYPAYVQVNGGPEKAQALPLDQAETIRIPLSGVEATTAHIRSDPSFPLQAPDTRDRSFRVVNIDFD